MDLAIFDTIAKRIETEWSARGFDDDVLAGIACDVFDSQRDTFAAKLADPNALFEWALTAPWPEQVADNEYGHPTFALARTERLRVEMIFWMGGVTAVHGHTMPGLFYVLHGERLHVLYDFEPAETSPRGFVLGNLRVTELELLGPGALRRIEPNDGTIHAVAFFGTPGSPCVTLSVRGLNNTPRYFENDHVFVVDADARVTEKRLCRAFLHFIKLHPEHTTSMAKRLLERDDADVVFAHKILQAVRVHAPDDYESLRAHIRERFGEWSERIIASSDRWLERGIFEGLLMEPGVERGPRILLALVWADAEPKLVLDVLTRAFPDQDPLVLVDRWMVAIRGPRTPQQEFAASMGMAPEDELSAQLRRFRKRLSQAARPAAEPSPVHQPA
jgi:predicted metal-dependent enzyme (double-stranded beta helix superfamily)